MSLVQSDPLAPTRPAALVVMARLPRAGRCKTRLCPPLSHEAAAGLYRAFLHDIGQQAPGFGHRFDLFVAWVDDPGEEEQIATIELLEDDPGLQTVTDHSPPLELQSIFPPGTRFLRQQGDDLSERMNGIFDRLLSVGYRAVIMRNSDSPHLPGSLVAEALQRLEDGPPGSVVLGPDLDGGYYLVGLDSSPADLFPDRMSTSSVLEETCARAAEQGREVQLLSPFLDIDSPDDLRVFWLEFGGRADVRDWATWRRITSDRLMDLLEE